MSNFHPLEVVCRSGETQLAQRWADGMNMWPSAVGTFNRPSACLYAYKKFVWVLSGLIEILIRNIFKNLKTLKKIKSWSGGYTTSLQN